MEVIREEVKKLQVENNYLAEKIEERTQELEQAKLDKEEQDEAKRIAEEEESKKKGAKKGLLAPAKKK